MASKQTPSRPDLGASALLWSRKEASFAHREKTVPPHPVLHAAAALPWRTPWQRRTRLIGSLHGRGVAARRAGGSVPASPTWEPRRMTVRTRTTTCVTAQWDASPRRYAPAASSPRRFPVDTAHWFVS